jgi:hypothetical protein
VMAEFVYATRYGSSEAQSYLFCGRELLCLSQSRHRQALSTAHQLSPASASFGQSAFFHNLPPRPRECSLLTVLKAGGSIYNHWTYTLSAFHTSDTCEQLGWVGLSVA